MKLAFEKWMEKVDAIVSSRIGLTTADLPDKDYMTWYEEGVAPKTAASRAIRDSDE